MKLDDLWCICNLEQRLVYEVLNDDDTVSIEEYTGDDRYGRGADEVYEISADYMPEYGYVIVAHML